MLVYLDRHPECEVFEIASALCIPNLSAIETVQCIQRNGWIRKPRVNVSKKIIKLQLTAKGTALARKVKENIAVTDLRIGRVQTNFSANRLGMTGRSKAAGFLPEMTPEQVAAAIFTAVGNRRPIVTLRWLDRLLILANRLFPNQIGQRASRQYKPD